MEYLTLQNEGCLGALIALKASLQGETFVANNYLVPLTHIRLDLQKSSQSHISIKKAVLDEVAFLSIELLRRTTEQDKHLNACIRDLNTDIHCHALSYHEQGGDEIVSELVKSLQQLIYAAADINNQLAFITVLELVSNILTFISKMPACSGRPLVYVQRCMVMMYSISMELFKDSKRLSNLIAAALLKCVGKFVKFGKMFISDRNYMSLVGNLLLCNDMTSLLNTSSSLCWRSLLKVWRKFLKYIHVKIESEMNQPEELQLSQMITWQIMEKMVQQVPVVECCGSPWPQCLNIDNQSKPHLQRDLSLLRCCVSVILNASVRVLANLTENEVDQSSALFNKFGALCQMIRQRISPDGLMQNHRVSNWMFDLFLDQDDLVCDALMSVQDLYLLWHERWKVTESEMDWFEPVDLFSVFLQNLSHDHSVLVDLLFSPETNFLTYFTSFLRHLVSSWHQISLQLTLDKDLDGGSRGDTCTSGLVSITSGIESLLSYNDLSDEEGGEDQTSMGYSDEASFVSDAVQSGSIASLENTLKTLDNVRHLIINLSENNQCPFDIKYLLSLLGQVQVLAMHSNLT